MPRGNMEFNLEIDPEFDEIIDGMRMVSSSLTLENGLLMQKVKRSLAKAVLLLQKKVPVILFILFWLMGMVILRLQLKRLPIDLILLML